MKRAQRAHAIEHRTTEFSLRDPCCTERPAEPPRRVGDGEIKASRRALSDAWHRFLIRCHREGLLDVPGLQKVAEATGIALDPGELKS